MHTTASQMPCVKQRSDNVHRLRAASTPASLSQGVVSRSSLPLRQRQAVKALASLTFRAHKILQPQLIGGVEWTFAQPAMSVVKARYGVLRPKNSKFASLLDDIYVIYL